MMNAQEIQDWMTARLAALLHVAPERIDVREPFANYGLSSRDAVALSGDLEQLLDCRLSPTVAYEYPCIAALSHHLAGDDEPRGQIPHSPSSSPRAQEPVAIIGMSCRFPGAKDPESFWRLLRDGVDAVSEVPADRWPAGRFYHPDPAVPGKSVSIWGGFLDRIDYFDPFFFGISPREAENMDPQQRLLLELSFEALEDAGLVKDRIAGSSTGVFLGLSVNEYSLKQFADPLRITGHSGTGSALSIAANRISYFYDFHGPSIALDTACSSSLGAVHLACRSLASGECSLAMVGGVNLVLSPAHSIAFTKAGVLAPDGRCKSFDARANGYVRGEGGGLVVLKLLSQALADGDTVRAVILGSAMNQDGRTNGLMAPSREAQEAMLREAYRAAGISPGSVQYVEAHGTGTLLGDPIEAGALGAVVGAHRTNGPCAIGSVKTNIGHLEAAAGIAGLIKVVLSMNHGTIPPSLHYQSPNPHIPFEEIGLRVQSTLSPWPPGPDQPLAGVSSFGFGGTNVHLVVRGTKAKYHDEGAPPQADPDSPSGCTVLPLSAFSEEALRSHAGNVRDFIASDPHATAHDICYTAAVKRSHHDCRCAVVGHSVGELRSGLQAFLSGEHEPGVFHGRALPDHPKLAFVFPGQGGQWLGMGRGLLSHEPVFRRAIELCDRAMRPHIEWSLFDELCAEPGASRLQEIDVVQPVLFGVQIALAALWKDWGIIPDAVIGHSMGEVAAAHVAGILTLEDAAQVICRRSRLLRPLGGQGSMMVTELSPDRARELVKGYDSRVAFAASNSPSSTVLSGDPVVMQTLMDDLQRQNLFCRLVNVDIASHSPQMDPLRAELLQALEGIHPQPPRLPLASTVGGPRGADASFDASYWADNLREPVLFLDAMTRLIESGFSTFVEIGPHPILLSAIQQILMSRSEEGTLLPSLRREEPERDVLRGSLGALYTRGYPVNWERLYPEGGTCMPLPLYPWQRERFWLDTPAGASKSREYGGDAGGERHTELLGDSTGLAHPKGSMVWHTELDLRILGFLEDHRVGDDMVLPAAVYIEMAFEAAEEAGIRSSHELVNFVFEQKMVLQADKARPVQVLLYPEGSGDFSLRVYSREETGPPDDWLLHASALFRRGGVPLEPETHAGINPDLFRQRAKTGLAADEFYRGLWERGLRYGSAFRSVEYAWSGDQEALGRLELPASLHYDAGGYQFHPALLDGCIQVAAAMHNVFGENDLFVPAGCKSIRFISRPGPRLWSHVSLRSESGSGDAVHADIRVSDENNRTVAELSDVYFLRTAMRAVRRPQEDVIWLYRVRWQAQEHPSLVTGSKERKRNWLVFGDAGDLSGDLVRRLESVGDSCRLVTCGDLVQKWNQAGDDSLRLFMESLLHDPDAPLHGVVHMWSLGIPPSPLDPGAGPGLSDVLGCRSVLHLVQALSRRPGGSPRVSLVTRGAQCVQPGEPIAVERSPLWGFGKVISFELPELKCTRIDLDPGPGNTQEVDQLFRQLCAEDREDQVAFRGQTRFVPRLVRFPPSALTCAQPVRARADGSYLITGGLGGLGLAVARWLAEKGCRHLVLCGRSAPSGDAEVALDCLRRDGVEVLVAQTDVSDTGQVAELMILIEKTVAPLRGVVHCAGVLDDGAVLNLDSARMKKVMAPKVDGTRNLHAATSDLSLDFFVLFSSAVSVLGSPGQANYAAASAYLDAMAQWRHSLGLPCLSINWGPWGEVGLAAAAAEGLRERGASTQHMVKVIAVVQGMEMLEQCLAAQMTQIAVLPFDLINLLDLFPQAAEMPFFSEVRGSAPHISRLYARPKLKEEYIAPRTGTERKLAELWQQTLHIDRVGIRDSFFALGGDSVLGAQIVTSAQRVFGIRVNLQQAFKTFTIEQLAGMLEEALLARIEGMTDREAQERLGEDMKKVH